MCKSQLEHVKLHTWRSEVSFGCRKVALTVSFKVTSEEQDCLPLLSPNRLKDLRLTFIGAYASL